MKLKKIALGLSLFFIFSTSLAFASPIQQLEQQLQETKEEYNQVLEEIGQIESVIEEIDNQAYEIHLEINKNEDEIQRINEEIELKQEEIKKAEEEFEKRKKIADERIKNMYMNGTENYIELILGFTSFSDLISRIETVKTIIQFDINALEEINKGIEELNKKKEELELSKAKILELKKQNEQKLALINEKKKEQQRLIAELEAKKKKYANQIKKYQAQIYQLYNQVKAKTQKSASRGSTNFSSDDVIEYAMRFLGTPYVWGGTTPSGFDCSGFVKYVYSHFGINLPRTSREQATVGQAVSLSEAQPGDLVFFHSPISHVGIYVGNGMYIHAPRTGDVVKVSSLAGRKITVIKRIK
ncbi:C40 family peptidase [Thermobrachium celere]|uniref:N-acetylmuramoyl-L-alanine amidase-like protein n=2 Tax=Thermobrachium TaxID=150333 RepID=R7RV52_9CLOT|nr:C40 family peptidase [Thermobrachium celere]CDF59415.1 N-acetylmuramoyl-L-alanine amidase-like protein [Thermobrachium celere DSM 8682]